MKYRKKPVVIEAIQLTEDNFNECVNFITETSEAIYDEKFNKLEIVTLEGNMVASIGDYIIRGVSGECYPCKPDIFAKTYEEVKE